jgi:hypothetical protein
LIGGSVTGHVFVRDDRAQRYLRLQLHRGLSCPGDSVDAAAMRRDALCGDALVARVPAELTRGTRLMYYAVLHDPASGRSVTIPTAGSRGPQRIWVVDRFQHVSLGTHRFGHLRTPDRIVARAGRSEVAMTCCADPPGGDGPSSFDVAADGSTWVLDRLNHRLLVWRRRDPLHPARSVQLPRSLAIRDFALGRTGTIFARAGDTADLGHGPKEHLYAFTPTGRLRWRTSLPAGIAVAQLQLGPDGALEAMQTCGLACAPFGGHLTWVTLTTPVGRPLTLAERSRRAGSLEPVGGGLRLVSQVSYSVARFALVNGADAIVRAWAVTSRTRMSGLAGAPALVGGDPVVPLQVSAGARWERLVLRLDSFGSTRVRVVLADRPIVGEVNLFAPLRIAADGTLFELRTTISNGASVAAYALGPR